MQYSVEEIKQYAAEEDVKFIRMAFCDAAGRQKNIAIMPEELDRAFQYGIAIDGSAIPGFGGEVHSDLLLRPDPSTLCVLPWRPEHGRVGRLLRAPDGPACQAAGGGHPRHPSVLRPPGHYTAAARPTAQQQTRYGSATDAGTGRSDEDSTVT